MLRRGAALMLVLALAATLPVPLSACAMLLLAFEECQPAPHCPGMDLEPSVPAAKLVAEMPCCRAVAALPQAPGAIKKDAAPEVTLVGPAVGTKVADSPEPTSPVQVDSSQKVSPPERQALLCVFLI